MNMSSPSRNNNNNYKRTRKAHTFSNTVVQQTDVGEFQGGYFVMPSSKENENLNIKSKNNQKAFSPSRRKPADSSHNNNTPNNSRSDYTPNKKNVAISSHDNEKPTSKQQIKYGEVSLLTPSLLSGSIPSKSQNSGPSIQSFILDHSKDNQTPQKSTAKLIDTPLKDSTVTPSKGHFAGPAFGNAPPPSSLPIPQFNTTPSVPHKSSVEKPSVSVLVSTSPPPSSQFPFHPGSHSPPTHPAPHLGPVAFMSHGGQPYYVPQPHSNPNLDQLSTDLRRMLNITGSESAISV